MWAIELLHQNSPVPNWGGCWIIQVALLLGRIAVCTPIAAHSHQTFPLAICWPVCPVDCGKTRERIWMPFGMVGRSGPWMRHVVEFGDQSMGRGNFGGKYGVAHCN